MKIPQSLEETMRYPTLAVVLCILFAAGQGHAQSIATEGSGAGSIAASTDAIASEPVQGAALSVAGDALQAERNRVISEEGQPPADELLKTAIDALQKELGYETSGSLELDYVQVMIRHHLAMIDAARIVVAFGEDEALRNIAENIIADHQAELAQLQPWLENFE